LREAVTCREESKESDREKRVDWFHGNGAFLFDAVKEARPEFGALSGRATSERRAPTVMLETEAMSLGSGASMLNIPASLSDLPLPIRQRTLRMGENGLPFQAHENNG
jgi:hypothetical protein